MHFPNIFRFVELAEHEFLKSRGILVFDRAQGGWPRVKVSCEYKRPLLTGDTIVVELAVTNIGTSSLSWNFEILTAKNDLAAFGSITTVRVDHEGRPLPITSAERAALR